MGDYIFIFFAIFIITGLIYLLYIIMLDSGKKAKDTDLQITSKEIAEQIKILYKQKQYAIAKTLARKYLEKKPYDTDVRKSLAKILYAEKHFYEAIEHLKKFLKQLPKDSDANILLANCYIGIEKNNDAIETLQEFLKEDAENITALKEIAQLYVKTNQKLSAIKIYKKLENLLENNLEKVKVKVKSADIHIDFQDFDNAIKEYEEILAMYPDNLNCKKELVKLYMANSNYDLSINLANEILQSLETSDKLWAMEKLMETYTLMGAYEKALEYANLIKENPLSDKAQSDKNISQILIHNNQIDDSINVLTNLMENNPDDIQTRKMLAKAYELKEDFSTATDIYKDILEILEIQDLNSVQEELGELYSNWAVFLFSQNANNDAFKKFSVALEYDDKNPEIYYKLGNVNKEIKDFNEAISQYKKAIELNSQNPQYYSALAECYVEVDNIYEEKKALMESVKYDPENVQVNYRLGIIYNLQNDFNKATFHLKEAIKLDENFIPARHQLALMFEHKGDKEEAIKLYESILKIQPDNQEIVNNLRMLKAS